MVILFEFAVELVAQIAFDVRTQVILSPLTNELEAYDGPLPTKTPFTFH